MDFKILTALAIFSCFGLAASMNMTFGVVGPYDVLLYHDVIKKSSSFLQVVTTDITFPQPYHRNNRTITAIRLTDQMQNGTGGYAQIYAGGPGFNHTTIHFKSKRNKGFNFIMEIFCSRF